MPLTGLSMLTSATVRLPEGSIVIAVDAIDEYGGVGRKSSDSMAPQYENWSSHASLSHAFSLSLSLSRSLHQFQVV